MNRTVGFVLVAAMALGLNGCASSGAPVDRPTIATRSAAYLASGPVPQDPNPRGGVVAAEPRTYETTRGIPTPEPAVPQREPQFAGPTPQIPIPGGRAGIPSNW